MYIFLRGERGRGGRRGKSLEKMEYLSSCLVEGKRGEGKGGGRVGEGRKG